MKILKGQIIVYRVFDCAEEIDLKKIADVLRSVEPSRVRIAGKARDAVVVRDAPVRLSLGDVPAWITDVPFEKAQLSATVWNYGVISIAWHFQLNKILPWTDLVNISSRIQNDPQMHEFLDRQSEVRVREVIELIGPAILKKHLWDVSEDYTLFLIEKWEGSPSVTDLLKGSHMAQLLMGESSEPLSLSTAESVLDGVYQYADNDLTVIDWNSALVIEPSGQSEIPDVIEFALTQLLEVRFFDDLIDKRLNELYHSVEQSRRKVLYKSVRKLANEANTRYLEFSEFMERMGNSLKVFGDFYLARIYRGAIRRFRVRDWEENITRKMNLLARVSELLQGESNVRRSHLLELIIILLILYEIIAPNLRSLIP